MKLSAPIYRLKRKAKILSRKENIPLHEALDRIAIEEGYSGGWSLLAAKLPASSPSGKLLQRLNPGDLVLMGARPGQGKTLMSLELAVEAMKSGNRAAFFTLEYTEGEVRDRLRTLGAPLDGFKDMFEIDCSDVINADYIMERMASAPPGTLVVVDYLQLLDQKRENPELAEQVLVLKRFAQDRGLTILFISQIDRSYDPATKPCPGIEDIRLPNPLNLGLFNKTCFLNNGQIEFQAAI